MTIKIKLSDSAAEAIRKQSEALKALTQPIKLSDRFRKQIEDINRATAEFKKLHSSTFEIALRHAKEFESLASAHKAMHSLSPPLFEPKTLLETPESPSPPMSEAEKTIIWINDQLVQRKESLRDPKREQVVPVITLPSGRLLVTHMRAEGATMVHIEGFDIPESGDEMPSGELRSLTTGAMSFEVKFVILPIKLPKPDLKLV